MSTVLAAIIISAAFAKLNVAQNPPLVGIILAFIGGVSYLGSAAAYYLAGKNYIAFKKKLIKQQY
jgi:hypothetical protein